MRTFEDLIGYLGEGGCVAFEHGYERPVICYNYKRVHVTMVDTNYIYGYQIDAKEDNKKNRTIISLDDVNKTNIDRL